MKFEIYTDESYTTGERYRSIAAFSFKENHKHEINRELENILNESDVTEFKWQKLKNAKYKFCAIKLINFVLNNIKKYDIRVDIIIWDTYDSRHAIQGRDDEANFERMFFHLLEDSLKKRPKNSSWNVFPDQRHGIDWDTAHDCLKSVGKHTEHYSTLFGDFFTDPYYKIDRFNEIDSSKTPCCQIADLFAGISVFSIYSYKKYCTWKGYKEPSLLEEEEIEFTNSEKVRFEVMQHLDSRCKKLKLRVSLKSKQRFLTFDPQKPINFWHYTPQHKNDKAPRKFS